MTIAITPEQLAKQKVYDSIPKMYIQYTAILNGIELRPRFGYGGSMPIEAAEQWEATIRMDSKVTYLTKELVMFNQLV